MGMVAVALVEQIVGTVEVTAVAVVAVVEPALSVVVAVAVVEPALSVVAAVPVAVPAAVVVPVVPVVATVTLLEVFAVAVLHIAVAVVALARIYFAAVADIVRAAEAPIGLAAVEMLDRMAAALDATSLCGYNRPEEPAAFGYVALCSFSCRRIHFSELPN